MRDHTTITTVFCLIFAAYFFLREVAQMVVMVRLKLAKAYFFSFWNYLDFAAPGLATYTIYFFHQNGPSNDYNHISAIAALLMWLKFLSLIKALNKEIATFILLLSTIFKDLWSFMFVLGCVMLMFGHAFFLMLGGSKDNESFETGSVTIMTLYGMVLGNYEYDDFTDRFTLCLSIFYMLLVVIVMTNVLIAIVSDSYDSAMVRSSELFWRARLELVAEVSSTFKYVLKCFPTVETYDRWLEWLKKQDEGNNPFGEIWVAIGMNDNEWSKISWAVHILFSPLILTHFILGSIYELGVIPLIEYIFEKWKKRAEAKVAAGIELNLDKSTSSDEWGGRVLDIVKRINTYTSIENVKIQENMSSELIEVKSQLAAITAMLHEQQQQQQQHKNVKKNL